MIAPNGPAGHLQANLELGRISQASLVDDLRMGQKHLVPLNVQANRESARRVRVRKVRQEHGLTHQVKPAVVAGSSKHSCGMYLGKAAAEAQLHQPGEGVCLSDWQKSSEPSMGFLLAGQCTAVQIWAHSPPETVLACMSHGLMAG